MTPPNDTPENPKAPSLRLGTKAVYFSEAVNDIRDKYNISKSLKVYLFSGYKFGDMISKFKFAKINFEEISIDKKEFQRFRADGIIKNKKYTIVSAHIGDHYSFLLFTNDLKSFEADYFKTKIEPRKGLFRLQSTCLGTIMIRVDVRNVTKPIFNLDLFEKLNSEINNFMAKEQVYKVNNLDYKRGILLYGLPGNGKTCFIKHLLKGQDAISIICDAKSEQDIDFVYNFLNDETAQDYYKIIVLEDIDRVSNEYVRSKFLNLVDGILPLNKTLFIATSNNPKNLDHALTNRPSRFDSLCEIESPNTNSREQLLHSFFPAAKGEDILKAINMTKDYRGAHFKEIFLVTQLYDCTMLKAIDKINEKFKAFKEFTGSTEYLG